MAQLGSALRSGRRGRRFKSCYPDQVRLTANTDPMGRFWRSFQGQRSKGVAHVGGSLLLRGLVVLGPGGLGEVVQAARRCSGGAGVVDRLDGEEVSELVFEVVVDDLV